MPPTIDAATLEIVKNQLVYTATQMAEVMRKTAFSHIAREGRDLSASIHDHQGRLLAQGAEGIPIHLCGASYFVANFFKVFPPETLGPNDILISNDPYKGGQHLPDITLVAPFFHAGKAQCFLMVMLHHTDIGGVAVGGLAGDAREIYGTGLIIPISKLNESVRGILAANVRVPDDVMGDLRAQIAGIEFGRRRLTEIYDRYGASHIHDVTLELLAYSERRVRTNLAAIPDGSYTVTECMDDDGIHLTTPVPLVVKVEKRGTDVVVDFTGSSAQTMSLNSPIGNTISSVSLSLRMFLDPDIPPNEGCDAPLTVIAPSGTINNPNAPAAVNTRATVCHRQEEAIIGGMAHLMPHKSRAASYGCSPCLLLSGQDEESGRPFVLFAGSIPGGMGARSTVDGVDGITCDMSNTHYMNVETIEEKIPLLVERQEFRPDSGGPGLYRGGAAVRQVIRARQPMVLTLFADRQKIPAFGLFGGQPGGVAEFLLNPGTAEERTLHSKTTNLPLHRGDVVSFSAAGGGGYGDPLARPPEQVMADVRNGKLTVEGARDYGVAIDTAGGYDELATHQLRDAKRRERGPIDWVIDRGESAAVYTGLPARE
ncbi:MAG: hydantoinase B/oxoprolinase family protein [Betaproteobacteria bacterium]|nr:hydantoinase B/oxoprolinase family protein [Betaproteobacteria bacterium]